MAKPLSRLLPVLLALTAGLSAQPELEIATRCQPSGALAQLTMLVRNHTPKPQSLKLPAGMVFESPSGPLFLAEAVSLQLAAGQETQTQALALPVQGPVQSGNCIPSTNPRYRPGFLLTHQALQQVQGKPPLALLAGLYPTLQSTCSGRSLSVAESDEIRRQVVANDPVQLEESQQWAIRLQQLQPPPPPPPPPTPTSRDRILGGDILPSGAAILSPNGQYRMILQHDGNCVIYKVQEGRAMWSTATLFAHPQLMLSPQGRLSLLTSTGEVRWESGPGGPPGEYHLQIQDDGNLVIYRRVGGQFYAHWASQREGRNLLIPR